MPLLRWSGGFRLRIEVRDFARKPAAQLYNLTLCVNSLRELADALIFEYESFLPTCLSFAEAATRRQARLNAATRKA